MATMAAMFRRSAGAAAREDRERWVAEADPYRLRPLPGEDVYFYAKRIDNSRIVRQADPLARRRTVRAVSMSLLAAIVLMILVMPHGLSMIAGYRIDALQREQAALKGDKMRLAAEESQLLSPARLNRLAAELKLVGPDPRKVVYPQSPAENALALNAGAKAE